MYKLEEMNEYISSQELVKPEYEIPLEKNFSTYSKRLEAKKGISLYSQVSALNYYYQKDQAAYWGPTYKNVPIPTYETVFSKGDAYVDNSGIITFAGDVSKEFKDDVLNSMLFAQFAANGICRPKDDIIKWYDKYQEVLQYMGWVMPGINFTTYDFEGDTFEVEKAVLHALLSLVPPLTVKNVVMAALNAMKTLADKDRRIQLFEYVSHTNNAASFQVANCLEEAGEIETSLVCMHLSTKQEITRLIGFGCCKADAKLEYNAQKAKLNLSQYSLIRNKVKERLDKSMMDYIDQLPLIKS